ncbi:MAG: peptidase S16 [Candidatus Pelagibacter sp.]|nr:peptidase S16 [Candidatus Pelagibacter sp.]|tara:strand:+ start:52 stop:708 length:657 start_codon:yes stop_codon:yes gene_type:complete
MKTKFNSTDLPLELPIFPLSNAIFFPKTLLPLNIFEQKYKQMTEHAVVGNNLIGMVQSNQKITSNGLPEVYKIGCVGYIEYHSKTPDGRYLINLKGISRFKIEREINTKNLYRKFKVNYNDYSDDLNQDIKVQINTIDLIKKTKKLFQKHQLSTNWKIVEKVEPSQLINSLAMICPFTISEKQRLLETKDIKDRNHILNQIINFYILGNNNEESRNIH